jgi:hypothetical protein
VWVHPSRAEAAVRDGALARVRAGGTAILLEPDEEDLRWLALATIPVRPFELAPSATVTGARLHFVRAGRMAVGLPAIGRGAPERLLLGPLYDDVVPDRPLVGIIPDAPAGSFPDSLAQDSDGHPATGTTDVAELPLGKGHLFVCTYRLLDHASDPVARALLFRMLNWDLPPTGPGAGPRRP